MGRRRWKKTSGAWEFETHKRVMTDFRARQEIIQAA